MNYEHLKLADPELYASMERELGRQRDHLELIASENFTSPAVMEAVGSHLTNKYAEGYPGARYYGGCDYVDEVERLAIDRVTRLFGADHANVQPHSGSQANMAVYAALLQPGDRILGMNLSHGGHLTHGSKASLSGKYFEAHFYGVDPETETIDYDALARVAEEVRPKLIIAGASAYPRVIDFARFRAVADSVGAYLMVDMAHIGGTQGGPLMHVIAGKAVCFGEALQPAFRAYQQQVVKNAAVLAETLQQGGVRLVSGGTDNHLMLADVYSRGRTGAQMQDLLDAANITANKNTIPFDTQSVRVTSGVRLGTPAVTTRGMGEDEMREIGALICRLIDEGEAAVPTVRAQVLDLCARFPLYPDLHM